MPFHDPGALSCPPSQGPWLSSPQVPRKEPPEHWQAASVALEAYQPRQHSLGALPTHLHYGAVLRLFTQPGSTALRPTGQQLSGFKHGLWSQASGLKS